ncbi:hypothetical protein GE09DRAFT_1277757 [Coniochaeta sp. 2T2.1]|nr:hypothetical protein GE09DRAFT_1277757 [Coniochaeta sp. 2T2.1]
MRPHSRLAPLLPLLLPQILAAPSWTTGNVTANPPFQISPSQFNSSIRGASVVAGRIPGYDVSLPPSAITPNSSSSTNSNSNSNTFWFLDAWLATNVPLSSAAEPGVDKDKYTQITAIGLQGNESQMWDERGWRVCATMFLGGVPGTMGKGFNPSPSCGGILPDECVQGLHDFAGANGFDEEGRWAEINSTILPSGNFFAYGAEPTREHDNVSVSAAAEMIWPVVINWAHLAENGEIQSSNAAVAMIWPVVINWAHLAENGEIQSSNAAVACMSNTGLRESSDGVLTVSVSGRMMWLAAGLAVLGAGLMS